MIISIKTLKSEVFQVNCDPTDTIATLKEKIALSQAEFPATRQKLIHSGKILQDDQTIGDTGITEKDFLVCMVTKEKVPPKKTETAAPAPTIAAPPPQSAPIAAPAPAPAPAPVPAVSAEIRQLTDMGFPENEARAALRAANGNSGLAIEYLMSGIPAEAPQRESPAGDNASELDQLRHHPQINHLRSLLQQNPEALGQVLQAIGEQNPELLRLINAHQPEFLAMMNEPIDGEDDDEDDHQGDEQFEYDEDDMEGDDVNPIELMQMFQSLSPEERAAAAESLGMTVEQIQNFAQVMGNLSPEQLQQMVGGAAAGGNRPQRQVVSLTQEEMNSVNRLMELGFSQQDAAAAFLACDKNEALAANLLLEGWTAQDLSHY